MNTTSITQPSSLLPAAHSVASALAPRNTVPANTTSGTSGSSAAATADTTDPSTITSSDFLTLLVSELQNQDPTQPTDPNAYISQLVGVNSLQQLISIDQGITSLSSAATATSTTPPTSGVTAATGPATANSTDPFPPGTSLSSTPTS
jgi:flagellar basal-body rod modification protein FlgD